MGALRRSSALRASHLVHEHKTYTREISPVFVRSPPISSENVFVACRLQGKLQFEDVAEGATKARVGTFSRVNESQVRAVPPPVNCTCISHDLRVFFFPNANFFFFFFSLSLSFDAQGKVAIKTGRYLIEGEGASRVTPVT